MALGVTGGIGSGKTEVCRILGSLGAKVLYADVLAKEVIAENAQVRQEIQRAFGHEAFLPDGKVDRKLIAALAFVDPELREKLNAIVHPPTLDKIRDEIRAQKDTCQHHIIAIEAALIYESGADKLFDYILVVEATEAQQIGRVVKRDKFLPGDVRRRMRAQMPPKEKSERADFIIRNTSDLKSLKLRCRFLFSVLERMSGNIPAGDK